MEALPSVHTTPPRTTPGQRSSRHSAKNSIKMSAKKTYVGSGKKPQVRRSFRTPIQKIPLKLASGKTEQSASRSFAIISDHEDMDTPRTNIERLLEAAVTDEAQPPEKNVTREDMKRTAENSPGDTIFKIPDQPSRPASPGAPAAFFTDVATPGSRFTPRTNILNLLRHEDFPEQTPTVRHSDDLSDQPPADTGLSTDKHQDWGQEVILSPIQLPRTSYGKDDSPSVIKQALKRPRRSFHIPATQRLRASFQPTSEQISADEIPTAAATGHESPFENMNAVVYCTRLEEVHASVLQRPDATSVTELGDLHGSVQSEQRGISGHSVVTPLSVLENLEPEVGTSLQGEHFAALEPDVFEAVSNSHVFTVDKELDTLFPALSGQFDAFAGWKGIEDNLDNDAVPTAADEVIQTETAENGGNKTLRQTEDLMDNEASGMPNTVSIDEGSDALVDGVSSPEPSNWVASKSDRCEMITDVDAGYDFNKLGHTENGRSSNVGQDVASLSNEGMDIDTENENAHESRVTAAKDYIEPEFDNEDVNMRNESKQEKSLGNNRTVLTSKHGKISCSLSPKKTVKDTQAPIPSVYDLSGNSSTSSGDLPVTKQRTRIFRSPRKGRHSSADSRTSSGRRRTSSAKSSMKSISLEQASFLTKKPKLGYSEWKAKQKGAKSPSKTASSFLDTRYPLSSTPFDRRKKIFHSTKIYHSLQAHEDGGSEIADVLPNISPIRPVAGNQEKSTGRRFEIVDADIDRDNEEAENGRVSRKQRESEVTSQGQKRIGPNEDMPDADFLGFSPLTTPQFDMNKRALESATQQKTDQRQFSRRRSSGPEQKRKLKQPEGSSQPPKKRKATSETALPRRSVKFFAERHSTMKLSKDAIEEIEKASEVFWEDTFKALEAYALHARRKVVKEQDVILLMQTQRLISDTEDLHDRIREFLPMELRSELIPMAKP